MTSGIKVRQGGSFLTLPTVKVRQGGAWKVVPQSQVKVRQGGVWKSFAPPGDQNIFTTQTPATADANDNTPLTLGTRFTTSHDGDVKGIRWYFPSTLPTGTVTAVLWDADTGVNLAQADFVSPVAGSWNSVTFSSPVLMVSGKTFIASIRTPNHYVASSFGFSSAVTNGDLTAVADGTGHSNGVFDQANSGAGPHFPTGSFNATNYFVDVVFAEVTSSAQTLFGTDPPTHGEASDASPGLTLCTLWSPDVDGTVGAIRAYFGATAPGVGRKALLYARTDESIGTELANLNFDTLNTSAWNKATLSSPVSVTANSLYYAAYWTPDRYVYDSAHFASSGVLNGNLHSPQDDTSTPVHNGRFKQSGTPGYPTSAFNSTCYFADVEFTPS